MFEIKFPCERRKVSHGQVLGWSVGWIAVPVCGPAGNRPCYAGTVPGARTEELRRTGSALRGLIEGALHLHKAGGGGGCVYMDRSVATQTVSGAKNRVVGVSLTAS